MLRPYLNPQSFKEFVEFMRNQARGRAASVDLQRIAQRFQELGDQTAEDSINHARYGTDIFEEVARYTSMLSLMFAKGDFDLIHAHDWMTFPAGVALAQLTGKPLVVHVHSLEFDRSGMAVNRQIFDIERFGIEQAQRVIAVSHYTKSVICQQHQVSPDKIEVVHNGVYSRKVTGKILRDAHRSRKIVLFLGRVTFQKGPDYFVEAAAQVVPQVPEALFVMAGSGDMLPRMQARVRELGIEDNFLFTGFLHGEEVEEVYSMADLYVMPSVSEPFGISALEAISFDTPVIISRQSGVAEVISHALKVDFWDRDRLSDLIVNALLHDELRQDMIAMAKEEVKRVHWGSAALGVYEVYRSLT